MQPILRVDLTSRSVDTLPIPPEWVREYLGGASLAARFLYEDLVPNLDPVSPQAPLLFLNGPLSGTAGPAVGRFVICGRSPATRIWGESNCGGFWGPELRMAGYDGLWVTGRSDTPVYLLIQDGQVDIRPAEHLWGLDTYTTQAAVQAENRDGKLRVAVIGPAGERRVPFALILTDHGRVGGRTGMGALMGSKNLKAIAVRGSGTVPVIDFERYKIQRSEANRNLRNDAVATVLRELGTAGPAEYFDYLGEMPKRYFQDQHFPEELRVSGSALKDSILAGVSACHACVIACGRVVRLSDGIKRKGPEYETLVGFGPNLGLNDPIFATQMGEICDRSGMDTISMSNVLGLAMLLYEKGIITLADTGGIELTWGNADAVRQAVHLTAAGEGFGASLAEGALALGRCFGAEADAVQVNGLEVAYHDPRGASGMALVYATSPRGACHNQSDYFLADIGQVEESVGIDRHDRLGGPEKSGSVARHQDWRTLYNSLVMCIFTSIAPETILELVNSACGFELSLEELIQTGERGWNLKRLINHRLGLSGANDCLPKAFQRPYQDHPDAQAFVPDFQAMLSAYYAFRGWHPVSGVPLPEKLEALGLAWAARKSETKRSAV